MTLNTEYSQLSAEVVELEKRDRAFDLRLAQKLLRIVRRHNSRMTLALKGNRECETAIADTLDALDRALLA